ncbi:uncharacterized protein LOC130933081 [Arachis stenosperma]|uniref:uncharacterized protein LOC130933081 n=1 Tax=Arachis stenosperma TaxID=217475 RepID=UPI0025AC4FF6|nr:uncharacterized protein LOC130933081 [Arachis stenosperma]
MAKKSKKIIPIDCIPKHSQQPRSSPPKRRTDFSVFVTTSSSASSAFSNRGSSPDSSSGEERLSSFITSILREKRKAVKNFHESTMVRGSNYQEGTAVCSSESFDVPTMEYDSAVQDEGLGQSRNNRDTSNGKVYICKMSKSIPHETSVSDSSSLALTPGTVIWARTTCQTWWPAEIMEERSALSKPVSDGQVLVQFYGNHSSVWIDPMTDISTFEDCFQERCSNPSKDFQEALKQAIQKKEQLSSSPNSSSDISAHSDQKVGSSDDKWTSPTSSRTMSDAVEKRRGNRERKRKVHFDEVRCPMKPERKLRRLKIMRLLGLAPPAGSPFCQ